MSGKKTTRTKAAEMLAALGDEEQATEAKSPKVSNPPKVSAPSRGKHFGCYIDKELETNIAILRAQLSMTNTELLAHLVDRAMKERETAKKFDDREAA